MTITGEKRLEYQRLNWAKNKDKYNKKHKEWYQKNKEEQHQKHQEYYNKNKEEILKHNKEHRLKPENHGRYILQHREYNKKYQQTKKQIVINYYSKGKNCCELCGITDMDVLTIDHINGSGSKHRNKVGNNIATWLIKNDFPEGFRILCMNCQYKERKRKHQFNPPNKIYF